MAKIIEGPPKQTLKRKCNGCKAHIEYEMADVKYGESGLDSLGDFYVECPVCGGQHTIKNPSPLVKSYALSRNK